MSHQEKNFYKILHCLFRRAEALFFSRYENQNYSFFYKESVLDNQDNQLNFKFLCLLHLKVNGLFENVVL